MLSLAAIESLKRGRRNFETIGRLVTHTSDPLRKELIEEAGSR